MVALLEKLGVLRSACCARCAALAVLRSAYCARCAALAVLAACRRRQARHRVGTSHVGVSLCEPFENFETCESRRTWIEGFVTWYDDQHRDSDICLITQSQRHAGLHEELIMHRHRIDEAAEAKDPRPWSRSTQNWDAKSVVRLNHHTTAEPANETAVAKAV